jgi:peptidoglycan/xylan/chitin deacetylase (PgdA/CDA1 family)
LVPDALLVRRGPSRARCVALTFDDGPDHLTEEYLGALDELDVRATFFVVGEACARYPDAVLEMVRRGHEVAGHGYTHRRFTELPSDALREELGALAGHLPPPLGRPLVRPPYGDVSLRTLATCALAGWSTVLWSLDSEDHRVYDAASVAARISPGNVRPGDILLLHEGQRWTIEALPTIVGRLREADYELVTVNELLRG